jgi:hypothetical protein
MVTAVVGLVAVHGPLAVFELAAGNLFLGHRGEQ